MYTNQATSSQEVYGIVLPDIDPLKQGRYKVYFPEKMQRPDGQVQDGIWCQNGLSGFRGYRNSDNQPIVSGSYRPIQPGAPVIITMTGANTNPTIARMAVTNINAPDPQNRDSVYVIEQTPDGSSIEIDSKKGYVHLGYRHGAGNILMTKDTISMELLAGSTAGKSLVSGISIKPDSISMQLKDSTMELNSTGFGVTLKDGSYIRMSKKGLEIYGEDFVNISSKKTASLLSKQVNINGTSQLHLLGSDTKVTGTQKMAMNGTQVSIESFLTTQLKGMHIGMDAKMKMTLNSLMYDNKVLGIKNEYASISSETATTKASVFSMLSESTSTRLQDSQVISNMGVGASVSTSLTASSLGSVTGTQLGLASFGTLMLFDNPASAAVGATLALAIPGSAQAADEPTGTTFGVKDAKDITTPSSVLNTALLKRTEEQQKYAVVPEAMADNARTLNYLYNA